MALTPRFWLFWGTLLLAPLVIFLVLYEAPTTDRMFAHSNFHFWVVSGTTLAAAVAYGVVIGLTRSLRETRLVFLGLAFMSIAAIFSVHGLLTPGHIADEFYPSLQISSWLSVLAGAFFIACSVASLPEHADHWLQRNGSIILLVVGLALGLYIGLSVATPEWLSWIPIASRTLQLGTAAVTAALLLFAAYRYFQAFLFARLPSQWAMVVVLLLLVEVQVSLTWGRVYRYSWWEYHLLYGVAFAVLFGGWAIEAIRAGSVRVIADALSMREAMVQLSRGYDHAIADLVDAIELKDLYTLGHVRRVASYALLIGGELDLSPVQLRNVALAAQMHDVGKIGVPDRILTKPSKLTAEEFDVIKEHVGRGFEIAQHVPALRPAAGGITYHHEKMDGTGYPDGLKGEEIPIEARIVAVADAFDAMTSGRVYQPAVDYSHAFTELRECAGSHFDPRVVDAFIRGIGSLPLGEAPGGQTLQAVSSHQAA
jgi:HD-GYP domain-containing protein (c-di-GMP phosphodiesterase class II)